MPKQSKTVLYHYTHYVTVLFSFHCSRRSL